MSSIHKIVLAFVIVQVAVVLAKPYEPENDDGLYQFSDDMDNFVYKREERCSVEPEDRINCGYGGINKQQCESKGCCFDNSTIGAVWCFKTERCFVEPEDRVNCGYGGINKQQCESKGCCFDDSVRSAIWCFKTAADKPPESCSVAPKDRKDCGHGGISKQECQHKGCCWDSSIRGAKWCFKSDDCGSSPRYLDGFNWSQRCRTSCRTGEEHVSGFDNRCSGADICCKCHNAWANSRCVYDA